ncbi:type I-E CRISPR-associated protein Cas7/Cse4/CasC [Trueperella bernardiae]|uniref:type I-E CRISPR-associated protein Cas7/Cse4/CasC n=1 Tax=Trueperella bernardiae TaxID=59561 RepID=UPI000C7B0457|nr:type I-E CRISPR-associated protein Cas7/Cse4/CasC [Trueperella bernardiae]PKZ89104.1 type I-E CRISPR-associated protein Cas7/Cse4/CasC [Trueperella bernardiae]
MSRNLTLHIVASVPYSNLNRDDSGTPKRVVQGGALRALHSSQAIKRGIRTMYEEASMVTSVRSGQLVAEIVDRAKTLGSGLDEKALTKAATDIVGTLTKKESAAGDGASDNAVTESDRSIWMSSEEIEAAAAAAVAGQTDGDFIKDGVTGSLAIAAFGRMFANAPAKNTEAAIAVSPAVTTHAATIDTDYFSTVDDLRERKNDLGATFLGVFQFTNGVFYRSVTIDKDQLKKSWTGWDRDDAAANLKELVNAIIYGQPRGKVNATAPYIQPALILAEEQRYRVAYDFETPVDADGTTGGYLTPTIDTLAAQFAQARKFDADNFGPLEVLSGTSEHLDEAFDTLTPVSKNDLIDAVVNWTRA